MGRGVFKTQRTSKMNFLVKTIKQFSIVDYFRKTLSQIFDWALSTPLPSTIPVPVMDLIKDSGYCKSFVTNKDEWTFYWWVGNLPFFKEINFSKLLSELSVCSKQFFLFCLVLLRYIKQNLPRFLHEVGMCTNFFI